MDEVNRCINDDETPGFHLPNQDRLKQNIAIIPPHPFLPSSGALWIWRQAFFISCIFLWDISRAMSKHQLELGRPASANIGVFICLKCCGVHRSLGTHISKVLSVTLDDWSGDEIDAMVEVGGNSSANAIYEAFIPEEYAKPGPDASHDERAQFIRAKYELQEFLKPSLRIVSLQSGKSSLQSSSSRKTVDSFQSTSSHHLAGMVEFIGLLKVKVIKGTNLAIRDMMSSDPYVVLTLGQQTVRTTTIKSNLNPVWNEQLMLSVPHHYGPLKLQVFDHDTFSADDIMGEAEVDLQPLITSAMPFGDAGMFGNIQIGKWLKSHDNALVIDSTVNIVDGRVKQEVSLKLQNVESGELDLELEWVPLDQ
ncbi:ADP-ribosylation factor GTPase-activating protein AGD12-like isoform X3 [Carya illinoinensis]|uniref:ADP-ribosylation factor GTPase-activating protein AGD12-like isoform X3 n=2 Tax=Carya illinoinensis TaxID=32201 RepID=UPI001C7186A2|nr:ADP-ribosylation factor GTPase-activating protein AGD12-like isoform X3 [Carya illinoinensis]